MILAVQIKFTTLALIGAGKWGKNYLKSCNYLPGVRMGYICTKNGPIKIEDLLKKGDIDGFIIATPTSTHFKLAKLIIENDKNVLIEKPVTDSSVSTKLLLQLLRKHPKSKVLAGHIQLYNPAYQALKKNIRRVGKIKKLTFSGLGSPTRHDTSVFWDWGPHPLYMFIDLIGKKATVKSSRLIPPDNAEIVLDFDGIEACIKIGWTSPKKVRELKVIGDKGELEMGHSKSKYTPLQNEVLHFAKVIRGEEKPISDLKQALAVAKIIEEAESSTL